MSSDVSGVSRFVVQYRRADDSDGTFDTLASVAPQGIPGSEQSAKRGDGLAAGGRRRRCPRTPSSTGASGWSTRPGTSRSGGAPAVHHRPDRPAGADDHRRPRRRRRRTPRPRSRGTAAATRSSGTCTARGLAGRRPLRARTAAKDDHRRRAARRRLHLPRHPGHGGRAARAPRRCARSSWTPRRRRPPTDPRRGRRSRRSRRRCSPGRPSPAPTRAGAWSTAAATPSSPPTDTPGDVRDPPAAGRGRLQFGVQQIDAAGNVSPATVEPFTVHRPARPAPAAEHGAS